MHHPGQLTVAIEPSSPNDIHETDHVNTVNDQPTGPFADKVYRSRPSITRSVPMPPHASSRRAGYEGIP
jgi:hypothetical protein